MMFLHDDSFGYISMDAVDRMYIAHDKYTASDYVVIEYANTKSAYFKHEDLGHVVYGMKKFLENLMVMMHTIERDGSDKNLNLEKLASRVYNRLVSGKYMRTYKTTELDTE